MYHNTGIGEKACRAIYIKWTPLYKNNYIEGILEGNRPKLYCNNLLVMEFWITLILLFHVFQSQQLSMVSIYYFIFLLFYFLHKEILSETMVFKDL